MTQKFSIRWDGIQNTMRHLIAVFTILFLIPSGCKFSSGQRYITGLNHQPSQYNNPSDQEKPTISLTLSEQNQTKSVYEYQYSGDQKDPDITLKNVLNFLPDAFLKDAAIKYHADLWLLFPDGRIRSALSKEIPDPGCFSVFYDLISGFIFAFSSENDQIRFFQGSGLPFHVPFSGTLCLSSERKLISFRSEGSLHLPETSLDFFRKTFLLSRGFREIPKIPNSKTLSLQGLSDDDAPFIAAGTVTGLLILMAGFPSRSIRTDTAPTKSVIPGKPLAEIPQKKELFHPVEKKTETKPSQASETKKSNQKQNTAVTGYKEKPGQTNARSDQNPAPIQPVSTMKTENVDDPAAIKGLALTKKPGNPLSGIRGGHLPSEPSLPPGTYMQSVRESLDHGRHFKQTGQNPDGFPVFEIWNESSGSGPIIAGTIHRPSEEGIQVYRSPDRRNKGKWHIVSNARGRLLIAQGTTDTCVPSSCLNAISLMKKDLNYQAITGMSDALRTFPYQEVFKDGLIRQTEKWKIQHTLSETSSGYTAGLFLSEAFNRLKMQTAHSDFFSDVTMKYDDILIPENLPPQQSRNRMIAEELLRRFHAGNRRPMIITTEVQNPSSPGVWTGHAVTLSKIFKEENKIWIEGINSWGTLFRTEVSENMKFSAYSSEFVIDQNQKVILRDKETPMRLDTSLIQIDIRTH
ncbi:MAG: hypothetical protein H6618_01035 [Deltaproteobacteria bacterium]|nr:hypothetical protein [Deltaproteobacteria bacterium]